MLPRTTVCAPKDRGRTELLHIHVIDWSRQRQHRVPRRPGAKYCGPRRRAGLFWEYGMRTTKARRKHQHRAKRHEASCTSRRSDEQGVCAQLTPVETASTPSDTPPRYGRISAHHRPALPHQPPRAPYDTRLRPEAESVVRHPSLPPEPRPTPSSGERVGITHVEHPVPGSGARKPTARSHAPCDPQISTLARVARAPNMHPHHPTRAQPPRTALPEPSPTPSSGERVGIMPVARSRTPQKTAPRSTRRARSTPLSPTRTSPAARDRSRSSSIRHVVRSTRNYSTSSPASRPTIAARGCRSRRVRARLHGRGEGGGGRARCTVGFLRPRQLHTCGNHISRGTAHAAAVTQADGQDKRERVYRGRDGWWRTASGSGVIASEGARALCESHTSRETAHAAAGCGEELLADVRAGRTNATEGIEGG
ncbi:hypothetical protein B0H17DRAFT_718551 [Mycena rosella]|uniref:Uncharacterized protein n=1 Tax=Mycena rosella TaxID=1033263 RepID=A0AAD7D9P3_MYCRO|nr:hypothetical protein B0H17DRAFT_718551 [Mycena rosella]